MALNALGPAADRTISPAFRMTLAAGKLLVKPAQCVAGPLVLKAVRDPGGGQRVFTRAVFNMADGTSFFRGITVNAAVSHQLHLNFAFQTTFIRGPVKPRMTLPALFFDCSMMRAHRARHQPQVICRAQSNGEQGGQGEPK